MGFWLSETKSACYNVSFLNSKCYSLASKYCKTMLNYSKYVIMYCISFNFVHFIKHEINKKHSSWVCFGKNLSHSIIVNMLFIVNFHQCKAWQSFHCHSGLDNQKMNSNDMYDLSLLRKCCSFIEVVFINIFTPSFLRIFLICQSERQRNFMWRLLLANFN